MPKKKLLEAFRELDEKIQERCGPLARGRSLGAEGIHPDWRESVAYALWLCGEGEQLAEKGHAEPALALWGMVVGILWSEAGFSLKELGAERATESADDLARRRLADLMDDAAWPPTI